LKQSRNNNSTKIVNSVNKNIKLRLISLSFLFFLLFSLTPIFQPLGSAQAELGLSPGTQASVSGTDGDGVRLRTTPSTDGDVVSTLGETWKVTILGGPVKDSKGNSFYKVEWANRTGYIMTQYLSRAGSGGYAPGSQVRVAGTGGDGVRLRSQPNTEAGLVTTLGENWLTTVMGGPYKDNSGNSFYKVEWTGRIGYVAADFLAFAGKSGTTQAAITTSSLAIGGQAKVTGTDGDGVRLRQQPNVLSPTLSLLGETYLVTVLGGPFRDNDSNTYYRVEWTGYTGYISAKFLNSAGKTAVAGTGGFMRVTNTDGDPIRFRSGAGRQFSENGYVYEGQVLKFLAGPTKDAAGVNWYRVERNGEVGYVDGTFLARTNSATSTAPVASNQKAPVQVAKPIPVPASNGPLGQRIADFARQFVGYRYTWAGTSPTTGFDCSGFIYYILGQVAGISTGHTVEADMTIGAAVPLDAMQPGDILIFANTYKAGPSHSGIYLGGGRFVHAESESSGVSIDNTSDSYYASRLIAARRPGV